VFEQVGAELTARGFIFAWAIRMIKQSDFSE